MAISVVVLTYNSEATLANTLEAALRVSNDIHVVDSFSSDRTPAIAHEYGANLVTHSFDNYAAQRNWAIDNLPLKHPWELHLDADECLSEALTAELAAFTRQGPPTEINGYCIPRLVHFMGRPIRHGGMFPIWHMRLFRRRLGRCEEREYDQHFIVEGSTGKLKGPFIDDIRMPLSEWVSRHNRWSDAEVRELLRESHAVGLRPALIGNPLERKRYFRTIYDRMPLFLRAWLLFVYRYVIRLGFLDGTEGLIFFFLQTLWFRFLIDAKIFEQQASRRTVIAETAVISSVPANEVEGISRDSRFPSDES